MKSRSERPARYAWHNTAVACLATLLLSGCAGVTSGTCPSGDDRGTVGRFASDECLKELFLPAQLTLPRLSGYDRVYWEIGRDEFGLSISAQLVQRERTNAAPIILFHAIRGERDLPDIIAGPVRHEDIASVRVKFDGMSGSRQASWSMDAVFYQVIAGARDSETDVELEAVLRPIVSQMIEDASLTRIANTPGPATDP